MGLLNDRVIKQFWQDYAYDIDLDDSFYHSITAFSFTQCSHPDSTLYNINGHVIDPCLMVQ